MFQTSCSNHPLLVESSFSKTKKGNTYSLEDSVGTEKIIRTKDQHLSSDLNIHFSSDAHKLDFANINQNNKTTRP